MVDPSDFKPMDEREIMTYLRDTIIGGIDSEHGEVNFTTVHVVAALHNALIEFSRRQDDEYYEHEEEEVDDSEDEPDTDTYGLGGNSDD